MLHPRLTLFLLAAVCATAGAVPAPLPAGSGKGLIVISPRAFGPALENFVAWKKTQMPAQWVALEDILTKSSGADDPEKLKRWLYTEWKERSAGYILLAGDVDVMPVRYMVLDRKTAPAFDYAFYPSDLYYGDVAKPDGAFDDWNARKEGFHAGYFGEVRGEANKQDPINYDGVDYTPELAVGRWPVSTAEEVQRLAAKTTAYEKKVLEGSEDRLRRAAFLVVDGWVDARGLVGTLAGKLDTGWKVERRFYGTGQPPNPAETRRILTEGAGFVVHTGHGQPEQWEKCLSLADLDRLTIAAGVPVFLSAGCSTAHFAPLPPYEPYVDHTGAAHQGSDHGEVFTEPPAPPATRQPGSVNPTCLGEQLLKRDGPGGVAYIGCNTGSQPFGLTLVDGFVSELARAKAPRLGDCWNAALHYYVSREKLHELKPNESWVPPSIFFQGMKFMVFGDPSLRLPDNSAPLPAEKDLRPELKKAGVHPRAQGGRGTCSVFTVTSALEYALAAGKGNAPQLSVEYLNWAGNQAAGRAVDGGFFSDLWKGYTGWGACLEAEMPYTPAFDPNRNPDATLITAARQQSGAARLAIHWIKEWNVHTGLSAEQLTGIRRTLASGWPVCSGLRWPKHEEWRDGLLQMRPPAEVFDGHSILLTGYRGDTAQPGGGTFTFFNSNRPDMECRMTWEYALAYMNDAAWIAPPTTGAAAP